MLKYALVMATALTVMTGAPAFADPPNIMLGTWVNEDSNTKGITRLVITQAGNSYEVQGFGKCHPTDCDWGKTEFVIRDHFGFGSSPTPLAAAIYETHFSKISLLITLESDSRIAVNALTDFTDKSGRPSYSKNYFMKKVLYVRRRPKRNVNSVIKTPVKVLPNQFNFGH